MIAMNARLDAKDLDPNDQKDLEALASRTGRNPGELLRELVHEALAERKRNGTLSGEDEDAIASRQRNAFEELIQELDALPSEGLQAPEGRPISENVDEYLYGWKK